MQIQSTKNISTKTFLETQISKNKETKNYTRSSISKDDEIRERITKEIAPLQEKTKDLKKRVYNYSYLCEKLGEPIISSLSRREKQYLKWGSLFRFSSAGKGKIRIKEVYEVPHIQDYFEESLYREIKGEYTEYIHNLLVLSFIRIIKRKPQNDFFEIMASKSELYRLFGFANESFFKMGSENQQEEQNLLKDAFPEEIKEYYTERLYDRMLFKKAWVDFEEILESALFSLHRRKIIDFIYQTFIKTDEDIIVATPEVLSIITTAQGNVLYRKGFETEREVFLSNSYKEYKSEVIQEINTILSRYTNKPKQNQGESAELPRYIENYWEGYSIWTSKEGVYHGVSRILGKEMIENFLNADRVFESATKEELEAQQIEGINNLIINRFSNWIPNWLEHKIKNEAALEAGFVGGESKAKEIEEIQEKKFKDYEKQWVEEYLKIADATGLIASIINQSEGFVPKSEKDIDKLFLDQDFLFLDN